MNRVRIDQLVLYISRFLIIYTFGGLFVDLDMESLKPFDYWGETYHCVITEENVEHAMLTGDKRFVT